MILCGSDDRDYMSSHRTIVGIRILTTMLGVQFQWSPVYPWLKWHSLHFASASRSTASEVIAPFATLYVCDVS